MLNKESESYINMDERLREGVMDSLVLLFNPNRVKDRAQLKALE